MRISVFESGLHVSINYLQLDGIDLQYTFSHLIKITKTDLTKSIDKNLINGNDKRFISFKEFIL